MKVYALVGKSGTGKSYQAMDLCHEKNIEAIIDDGLFIYKNNVVAGISAKRDPTKIGAIKTALFTKDVYRAQVLSKLRELKPESILILGTSDGMVEKIAMRLKLGEIAEKIYIESITTREEREVADVQRNQQGKHVVPVSSAQLKRQFSGYFMDPLRFFRGFGFGKGSEHERSVVRPTYSYLGDFYISEKAIFDIVSKVCRDRDFVKSVKKVIIEKRREEIIVKMVLVFKLDFNFRKNCTALQKTCAEVLESMTAFNVEKVDIEIKGLF